MQWHIPTNVCEAIAVVIILEIKTDDRQFMRGISPHTSSKNKIIWLSFVSKLIKSRLNNPSVCQDNTAKYKGDQSAIRFFNLLLTLMQF